ncbi:sigma-70 family RNA polymerase sigma factor [Nonomuraea wenchangensis]
MAIRIDDVDPERRRVVQVAVRQVLQLVQTAQISQEALSEVAASAGLTTEELASLRHSLVEQGILTTASIDVPLMSTGDSPVPEPMLRLARKFIVGRTLSNRRLQRIALMAGLDDAGLKALTSALRHEGISIQLEPNTSTKALPSAEDLPSSPFDGTKPMAATLYCDLQFQEEDDRPPEEPSEAPHSDHTAAVSAAREVVAMDRFRANPEKHLLTAEQEVGLAILLRQGHGLSDDLPEDFASRLDPADEQHRAWTAMIAHNLLLVRKIAGKYQDQGLEFEDLYQHGLLGLMRAVRKFDVTKGYKFSTYATWWIKQKITRAIADEGHIIRVPVHMHDTIRKVHRAEERLRAVRGYASRLDLVVETGLTLEQVDECRRLSRGTTSLDATVAEGATLADLIESPDNVTPGPEAALAAKFGRERVEAVLSLLSDKTADILRRRIGVINEIGRDADVWTLDNIGVIYGVSRERIRQIESKGLKTIRSLLGFNEPQPDEENEIEVRRLTDAEFDEAIRRAHTAGGASPASAGTKRSSRTKAKRSQNRE